MRGSCAIGALIRAYGDVAVEGLCETCAPVCGAVLDADRTILWVARVTAAAPLTSAKVRANKSSSLTQNTDRLKELAAAKRRGVKLGGWTAGSTRSSFLGGFQFADVERANNIGVIAEFL
jgi:hypothetical protein